MGVFCLHIWNRAFAFPTEQTLIICILTETFGQNLGACGMYLPCFVSADMIIRSKLQKSWTGGCNHICMSDLF